MNGSAILNCQLAWDEHVRFLPRGKLWTQMGGRPEGGWAHEMTRNSSGIPLDLKLYINNNNKKPLQNAFCGQFQLLFWVNGRTLLPGRSWGHIYRLRREHSYVPKATKGGLTLGKGESEGTEDQNKSDAFYSRSANTRRGFVNKVDLIMIASEIYLKTNIGPSKEVCNLYNQQSHYLSSVQ